MRSRGDSSRIDLVRTDVFCPQRKPEMTARHPPHRWAGGDRGIDQTGSRRRWFRVHGRLRSTRTYVGRQFRLTTLLRIPAASAGVLVAGTAAAPATRRHPRRPSWAPVPVRSTFRPSATQKGWSSRTASRPSLAWLQKSPGEIHRPTVTPRVDKAFVHANWNY